MNVFVKTTKWLLDKTKACWEYFIAYVYINFLISFDVKKRLLKVWNDF